MNDDGLSCPFCGGTDIRFDRHPGEGRGFHRGEDVWSTCCYGCGATFPNMYNREGLVKKWERRPSGGSRPHATAAEIKALLGNASQRAPTSR